MYDTDYIEWDDVGMLCVKCMACGAPIVERSYTVVPKRGNPQEKVSVMTLRRRSIHSEKKVELSDGSVTRLPHCTSCVKVIMTLEDKVKAQRLRIDAMKDEMVWFGRSEEEISKSLSLQSGISIVGEVA